MSNDVLLSILVPTKDRYHTLRIVVDSILNSISRSDVQVVVQDNSSQKESFQVSDNRVKYNFEAKALAISDNIDEGLSICDGKYIVIIGDDDFVSPSIMQYVDQLNKINGDILNYGACHYWWPEVSNSELKSASLWLDTREANDPVLQMKRTDKCVKEFLDSGGTEIRQLPKGYHGIVSKRLYNKISNTFGSFVPASSPDMAIAAALSFIVDGYHYTDKALTVFGASKKSGAGMTISKTHNANIENVPFLRKGIREKWCPELPTYWSQRIIYPQSFFEVKELAKSEQRINMTACYAAILVYEWHTFREVGSFILKRVIKDKKLMSFIAKLCKKGLGRFYLKIKGETPSTHKVLKNIMPQDVLKYIK